MLTLQTSAVCDAAPTPLLSVSIKGRCGPPPPPSAVLTHATLLSALLPQQVDHTLQTSNVNPPHFNQLLVFKIQQDVPPLQPLFMCSPHPPLSVLLQGQGKPPLQPSTLGNYVPLISALLLCKCVTICQTSAKPASLPQLSALPIQQGVPPIQPLDVRPPPLHPLSVLLQGLGVTPLLDSAVCAYAPLLW